MRKISSKIGHIRFDEGESILYVEVIDGANMTIDNLAQHYNAIKKVTKGRKHFALVDVKHLYTISLEGLEYAASLKVLENRLAVAYYSPPLSNRLNINFIKNIRAIPVPMDIFPTKETGLTWLKKLQISLISK